MRMRAIVILACLCFASASENFGYSFQEFNGPVSGPIREISVPHHHHDQYLTIDYVAKPDYLYSYGVEDPSTGNSHVHQETRDGDQVLGEYKVLQPDGYLRIVKYTADSKSGFKATVKYVKI